MNTWRKAEIQVESTWDCVFFFFFLRVGIGVGRETYTHVRKLPCRGHGGVHTHSGSLILLHTHPKGLIMGLMSSRPVCVSVCVCVCVVGEAC